MTRTGKSKLLRPVISHYDANYGSFQSELYAAISQEAFGEDIGQNSWLTAKEQDMFLDWLELSAEKTLLDVAYGSGGPALRMAVSTGCSVVGIDLHEQAISTANLMASQRHLKERVEFRVVSAAEQLPFPDARFDAITCIDAINHLPNRPLMIAECARLLKPGGRLLFTDPVTVTGPLTNEEIAVRSSIGFSLFVPRDYDERILAECGFRLLVCMDVTANMAGVAEKRRAAREAKSAAVRQIEGEVTYEAQQNFLTMTACLAGEGRLSRFVYLSEKSAEYQVPAKNVLVASPLPKVVRCLLPLILLE
jgi:2-polyprenyl-3-methyl-5-hydroxy-6-metoxy-1,4-benzoquinol methylase